MELLDKLIANPNILYIYEIGLQIFDLFDNVEDRDFLLIVTDDFDRFAFFEDAEFDDSIRFQIISLKKWFEKVLAGDLLAWECACLPKKFIHKEHVKLMLKTDPLELRKNFDLLIKANQQEAFKYYNDGYTLTAQKLLWEIVKYAKFANQIIENHKIVSFISVNNDYKKIVDGQTTDWQKIFDTFNDRLLKPKALLKKYTDDLLRRSKIKKIIQNG